MVLQFHFFVILSLDHAHRGARFSLPTPCFSFCNTNAIPGNTSVLVSDVKNSTRGLRCALPCTDINERPIRSFMAWMELTTLPSTSFRQPFDASAWRNKVTMVERFDPTKRMGHDASVYRRKPATHEGPGKSKRTSDFPSLYRDSFFGHAQNVPVNLCRSKCTKIYHATRP
jgi:hypothetical protein